MDIYIQETYKKIYAEVVIVLGASSARTITMMGEDDFSKYPPTEAIERIIVPIVGLFGKTFTKGMIKKALASDHPEEEVDTFLSEFDI